MALGRKTGGRQKGARNRATAEARAAAETTGILPLDYMLSVMRDTNADAKCRDAMAIAAAQYLHPKVSPVEAGNRSEQLLIPCLGPAWIWRAPSRYRPSCG